MHSTVQNRILNVTRIDDQILLTKQLPLDRRSWFRTKKEIIEFTERNYKVLPKGTIAVCAECEGIFVWTEWDGTTSAVIPGGFTYPSGYTNYGYNYSGKTFNWVPLGTGSGSGPSASLTYHRQDIEITSETNSVEFEYVNDTLEVYLNGLLQREGDDYTVSGNTITFTNSLDPGDVVTFISLEVS